MSPYKRGTKFYVEWTDERGKRHRKSSKARTMKEAELIEKELQVGSFRAKQGLAPGSRNPHQLTLQDAADRYLEKMKGRGGYDSLEDAIEKHIERSGLGELLLERVTTAVLDEYLDNVKVTLRQRGKKKTEGPPSPATRNRLRSMFSGCFRVVKKAKLYFGENPAADIEHAAEPEHHDRLIEPGMIREMLRDAPSDDWRVVFALAAYAGLRRSDIARLDLEEHVDLERRVITVVRGKDPSGAGKIRRVGIHTDLVPLIEAARDRKLDLRARNWQDSAKKAKDALGDKDAVFHGLRHTWATHLVECGARESVVEYMGWGRRKSSTFRKHYLDFPSARLVEEIDKLAYPPLVLWACECSPHDVIEAARAHKCPACGWPLVRVAHSADSNPTDENTAQNRHSRPKGAKQ